MTRINSDIDPKELCDQHLIAEYHEMPRITTLLKKRIEKHKIPPRVLEKMPKEFRLGAGHMMFWLDKGKFLETRFNTLRFEMQYRGFETNYEWNDPVWRSPFYNGWWTQTTEAEFKMRQRLREKLPKNARFTYRVKPAWYDENWITTVKTRMARGKL